MSESHKISEYIDNLPLKKTLCLGYRPDDVFEVIYTLTSMYNEILADSYRETEQLRHKLGLADTQPRALYFEPKELYEEDGGSIDGSIEEEAPQKEESADEGEEVMTDREMRRLKRTEILEIMLLQSRKNSELKQKVAELENEKQILSEKLGDKRININKAGSIAEASVLVSGVMESAQEAAQIYLDNLKKLSAREEANCTRKEAEAQSYVDRLLEDAEKQSERLKNSTADKCISMTIASKARCESMRKEAEEYCTRLEAETRDKCISAEEETRRTCAVLAEETEKRCRLREEETEKRCKALEEKAKQTVDERWEELSQKLEEFYNAREGLRDLLTFNFQ